MKKALLITLPIIAVVVVAIAFYYNNKQVYYYDFDEVIYYKTTKGFDELIAIDDKEEMALKDSVTNQLMGEFEEAVPYDVAATYLDRIGFEKKVLPVSKHDALMEIFREKLKRRTE